MQAKADLASKGNPRVARPLPASGPQSPATLPAKPLPQPKKSKPTKKLPPEKPKTRTDYRAAPKAEPTEKRLTRGPRHLKPELLRFTAILHIATRIIFVLTLATIPLAVVSFENKTNMLFVMPSILFFVWFCWLLCASKIGCRICMMRLFMNKPCVKSPKAPSWPLLGPHTTLAILSLNSPSVRCPYCGTPNQLDGQPRNKSR